MTKKAIFLIAVLTVVILVFALMVGCKKKAEERPQIKPKKQLSQKSLKQKKPVDFDVMSDITRAQKMLEDWDAGYYIGERTVHNGKAGKSRKEWKTQRLEDFNVLLAVENIADRKIEIIKLQQKGKQAPKGFAISSGKSNGVNTAFDVVYPDGYVLQALKRVVKSGKVFQEVVYTPYTKEIDTSKMRDAGLEYLRSNLEGAEMDLRLALVMSRAYGGLVADAVPRDVALTLSLIEHIDPGRFQRGEPVRQLMNEVLVIAAANGNKAYAYSVSPAGARGLFQFMPRTYRSVSRQYDQAGLDRDFVRGMENHRNAAKASLLLFDSDLSYLPVRHRQFLRKHPEAMGKYLAAAYNGGASRAARAIRIYRGEWESHVLPETQCYLKKFNAVWKILHS
ncbi:MAG TPA: transglycosylase SLT domain-containing protein [Patescibacteria group bacterium]